MTLIDTNVLVDVLTEDASWAAWSRTELDRYRAAGLLYISDMTYAELAIGIEAESKLQSALGELRVTLERIPIEGLFLAGKVFQRYRRASGPRTSVLPDFFIGAHAQVKHLRLLTRDARRYRTYFPAVQLITPE
jgi:predicted nucleic acid-binding protein